MKSRKLIPHPPKRRKSRWRSSIPRERSSASIPKKEDPSDGEEDFFRRDRNAGSLPADAGLNRFVWDLRYEGARKVPKAPLWGGNTDGPKALPGAYQVRLTILGRVIKSAI